VFFITQLSQYIKRVANIYLPEFKDICLLGKQQLDIGFVFFLNSISNRWVIRCDHHILEFVLRCKVTKVESCCCQLTAWGWCWADMSTIFFHL